jgi:carbohydrate-selective porin OprB
MKKTNSLTYAMVLACMAFVATAALHAQADTPKTTTALQQWWNGKSALADWFGLGYPLKDCGLSVTGSAKQGYYGQVVGGLPNEPKSNWAAEVKVRALYDFAKLFGIEGLTLESNWRYREIDGSQDTPYTSLEAGTSGASGMFNPNHMSSGLGMRIMTQVLQWQSDKTKDPRFMINLGWENPYEQFLQQPLSKMFENNAIESNKGIGGQAGAGIPVWNGTKYVTYVTTPVPWTSSYAAWGGTLRVKPSASTYLQSGLYLAISGFNGVLTAAWNPSQVYPYTKVDPSYLGKIRPAGYSQVGTVNANGQPTGKTTRSGYVVPTQNNHGFNFQGAGSFKPNGDGGLYAQNGLYNVNEFGWTPKLGPDKLEGKYAIGSYVWGQNNTPFTPTTHVVGATKPMAFSQNSVIWGLYLQGDQRLYAVKEDAPTAPSMGGKNAVAETRIPSKEKGLHIFNMCTFTPPQNNAIPFYFQTGLVYEGLVPKRDADSCGVALAAGFYSSYYNQYIDSQNQALKKEYNGYNVTAANTVSNTPPTAYIPHFTSTEVVEGFYNVQITKWAVIKPYAQWIVNPGGNGVCANELVMGASAKVLF